MASTLRSFANTNARLKPTIGDTKTSAVNNDHMGWLLCDGRYLNTSDYAHLYSVIGTSFGSDGPNTFRLPASQGRVPGFIGDADVGGNTWVLGDISGEETHLLTLDEIPAHNHNYAGGTPGVNTDVSGTTSSYTHNHGGNTGLGGYTTSAVSLDGGGVDAADNGAAGHQHSIANDTHSHQIASNGGDQRHNNIQPTIWIGNLFMYGGRPWVATPYARALNGANPVPGSNNYPPQGPPLNIY